MQGGGLPRARANLTFSLGSPGLVNPMGPQSPAPRALKPSTSNGGGGRGHNLCKRLMQSVHRHAPSAVTGSGVLGLPRCPCK